MVKKTKVKRSSATVVEEVVLPKKGKKRKAVDGASIENVESTAVVGHSKKVKKRKSSAGAIDQSAPKVIVGDEVRRAPRNGKQLKKKKKIALEAAAAAAAAGKPGGQSDVAGNKTAATASSAAAGSSKDGPSAETVDCTVFVDGVPYVWTVEKIKDFFHECGKITEVKAPTWQDSGRLRGYAHVTFSDKASTKKALALDGSPAGKKGRFLKIEAAKQTADAAPRVDIEGKRRLFVKNLPYDVTEAEVGNLFKAFGTVREVRIPTSFGRCKGFAYVEFAKAEFLKAAVQMSPAPSIRGRTLRLDADEGSGPKAGFHARPEAYQSGFGPGQNLGKGGRDGKSAKGGKGRGKGAPTMSLF